MMTQEEVKDSLEHRARILSHPVCSSVLLALWTSYIICITGRRVMTPTLIVLLGLGLCRGPWHQVQAEVLPKPSIWADPGPIVTKGNPVTIWCQGSLEADGYSLYKERSSEPLDTSIPQASSKKTGFLIQSMSSQNTGLYQCAYSTGGRLSERSELLFLVLTGMYRKPSLSAQPGPSVPLGANVTLQCRSEVRADTFHLHKEGSLDSPQQLHLQDTAAPSQANFTISPVTWGHYGTYSCYSSLSSSPFQLSHPSDPLELLVSAQGLQWYWNVVIGVLVALVLLLFLLLLLLLLRHRQQSKGRTLDAAMKDPQPGEGVELDPQAAASVGPQDVTYAQLTLKRETSAPCSSTSEQPPDEPSVYAALAIH